MWLGWDFRLTRQGIDWSAFSTPWHVAWTLNCWDSLSLGLRGSYERYLRLRFWYRAQLEHPHQGLSHGYLSVYLRDEGTSPFELGLF